MRAPTLPRSLVLVLVARRITRLRARLWPSCIGANRCGNEFAMLFDARTRALHHCCPARQVLTDERAKLCRCNADYGLDALSQQLVAHVAGAQRTLQAIVETLDERLRCRGRSSKT